MTLARAGEKHGNLFETGSSTVDRIVTHATVGVGLIL